MTRQPFRPRFSARFAQSAIRGSPSALSRIGGSSRVVPKQGTVSFSRVMLAPFVAESKESLRQRRTQTGEQSHRNRVSRLGNLVSDQTLPATLQTPSATMQTSSATMQTSSVTLQTLSAALQTLAAALDRKGVQPAHARGGPRLAMKLFPRHPADLSRPNRADTKRIEMADVGARQEVAAFAGARRDSMPANPHRHQTDEANDDEGDPIEHGFSKAAHRPG